MSTQPAVGNEGTSLRGREVFASEGAASGTRRASRSKDRPFVSETNTYESASRHKDRPFISQDNTYRRNSREKDMYYSKPDGNYERRASREKDMQIDGKAPGDRNIKSRTEIRIEKYVIDYDIRQIMQQATTALLKQQPTAPKEWLAEYFARVDFAAGTDTEINSATKLQALTRGQSSRNAIKEQTAAATKIQAVNRGKNDRQVIQEKTVAATKIQAVSRGKNDREEIKDQVNAATKIQAISRGKSTRKEEEKPALEQ